MLTKKLHSVEIDALVALKIVAHCRESLPAPATGQVMGIDIQGTLHVTHSYPFTATSGLDQDDVQEGADIDQDGSGYQINMLKRLRQLNYDVNTVGWYRTADFNLFEVGFIETQYGYQKTLPQSVALVYDPTQTSNLSIKAYRLSPAFMALYSGGKFSLAHILEKKITSDSIFEKLPVKIHNTSLACTLISGLEKNVSIKGFNPDAPRPTFQEPLQQTSPLSPDFDILELGFDQYLEQRLENMSVEVCFIQFSIRLTEVG
jgi:translation initiation factor 3 subunit H